MSSTIDLLLGHRSIRRYAPEPVADADVRAAVEAGQRASTSSSVQAYCLIRVRDPAKLRQLVELTGGQEKVVEAGAFFVVCGDQRRHRLAAVRHGRPYDARLEAFLLAVVDASLFAQNLVVAFESLGYGVCYVGGLRNRLPDADAMLDLPTGVFPLYGLCVGRPAEDPPARPRLPVEAVLFEERYPDDAEMLARMDVYDDEVSAYFEGRGKPPTSFSELVSKSFSTPRRTDLAAYYRSKGAVLE